MGKALKFCLSLFFYLLVPVLLLGFLAQPIGNTVRYSDLAAFHILLAASGMVLLNWLVCRVICRKRPSLLVFAHGIVCLLAVLIIQYEALPAYDPLASTLAVIAGFLSLAALLLAGFWFAARPSRPAHVAAVGLRIIFGVILCIMAYRVFRDIECRNTDRDTWITLAILVVMILARNAPGILSVLRRAALRRRASGLAEGRIVSIIGVSHYDTDDEMVTLFYAHIAYTVDDVPYELKSRVTRYRLRRYGKENFIGCVIPVHYNPADPADAFADRIDKNLLKNQPAENNTDPSQEETEAPDEI